MRGLWTRAAGRKLRAQCEPLSPAALVHRLAPRRRAARRGDDVLVIDDLSTGQAREPRPGAAARRGAASRATSRDTDSAPPRSSAPSPRPSSISRRRSTCASRSPIRPSISTSTSAARPACSKLSRRRGAPLRLRLDRRRDLRRGRRPRPAARRERRVPPDAPYGQTKLAAEGYLSLYRAPVRARRPPPCGSATSTDRARTRTARPASSRSSAARCTTATAATVFGDGEQTRDYIYVGDVVAAFLAAGGRGRPAPFNVGTGVETSVIELGRTIGTAIGVEFDPELAPGATRRGPADPRSTPAPRATSCGWPPRPRSPTGSRSPAAALRDSQAGDAERPRSTSSSSRTAARRCCATASRSLRAHPPSGRDARARGRQRLRRRHRGDGRARVPRGRADREPAQPRLQRRQQPRRSRAGRRPYALVLNPDTRITPGALDRAARADGRAARGRRSRARAWSSRTAASTTPRSALVPHPAQRPRPFHRHRAPARGARARSPTTARPRSSQGPVDAVNGAFMLIRRAALERGRRLRRGLLDVHGGPRPLLPLRARRAGSPGTSRR